MTRLALGTVALAVAGLLYGMILAALRRADRRDPSGSRTEGTWWFGYARDLANVGAAVAYAMAFRILGWPGHLAVLGDGDRVEVAAPDGAGRLLIIAAQPLREPVARYGPFVMNTRAELNQAFEDFNAGRF